MRQCIHTSEDAAGRGLVSVPKLSTITMQYENSPRRLMHREHTAMYFVSFTMIFLFLLQKTIAMPIDTNNPFQESPVLKYLTHVDAREASSKGKGFKSRGDL